MSTSYRCSWPLGAETGTQAPASAKWELTDATSPFQRRDSADAESPAGTAAAAAAAPELEQLQRKPSVAVVRIHQEQACIAAAAAVVGTEAHSLLAGCMRVEREAVGEIRETLIRIMDYTQKKKEEAVEGLP